MSLRLANQLITSEAPSVIILHIQTPQPDRTTLALKLWR